MSVSRVRSTHFEVLRRVLPVLPGKRDPEIERTRSQSAGNSGRTRTRLDARLDVGVLLLLERQYRLEEEDALVLLGEHFDEALHEVLMERTAVSLEMREEEAELSITARTRISSQTSSSPSRVVRVC